MTERTAQQWSTSLCHSPAYRQAGLYLYQYGIVKNNLRNRFNSVCKETTFVQLRRKAI
jgi:hypothetical protein